VFGPAPKIDPARVVRLIQQQPRVYKLDGQDRLRFLQELPDAEARAAAVERLLERLTG
jgi:transcription-repair coupling factor (superfamily II helicase)